jgi:type IV fimbrial biogenesis protein FimT
MVRVLTKGFTLLEVLVVMALAGILVAIAIPDFVSFMQNNTRTSTVNDLLASMHIARSEAITRNGRVMLCPSTQGTACDGGTDWEDGWIVFYDADSNQDYGGTDVIITLSPGIENYDIGSSVFESGISYRSNGRAMATTTATNAGEFIICDPRGADYARVIIVPPSGRPRSSDEVSGGGAVTSCPG